MIQPKEYVAKCPKCNGKKIIKHKSDALNLADELCKKCNVRMEKVSNEVGILDKMKDLLS